MKGLFCIGCLLVVNLSFSQGRSINFSYIDWKARSIEFSSPDTLAQKLCSPYTTDLEKVRSIFRWITENIAYRAKRYTPSERAALRYATSTEPEDTSEIKPLNERVALSVLKAREAVCDGYARLFKTLCDYAGIRAEIITGYARTSIDRMGAQFRSNHTWNAVWIDSSWHLLDATWASGYISYRGDEFVKEYDDYYFLTPPNDFIRDHYPEDARWTLLANPPTLKEFYRSPFKPSAFIKYSILSFQPDKGVIDASPGDTINLELTVSEIERGPVYPDTLKIDSALPVANALDSVQPIFGANKRKVIYKYVVPEQTIGWLNLIYNDDAILRYKLNIRRNRED